MPSTLTFLHTAPSHVNTFNHLLQELGPNLPTKHIVDESLLQEARQDGLTDALAARVHERITSAAAEGGHIILCTCSTIGACAEQTALSAPQRVIRIDRPMAEQAVALGSRIIVAATLASTLAPTKALLRSVANATDKPIEIIDLLCESAWAKFESGDQDGYLADIAQTLQHHAMEGEVIVLAQASMAEAIQFCLNLPVPVLSSPRLGLAAAIAAYQAL